MPPNSEARSPRPRRLQGHALCRCQGRSSSWPPPWLRGVPWLVAPGLHPGMGVSLSGVYVCVPVSPLIRTSPWMRTYPSDLIFISASAKTLFQIRSQSQILGDEDRNIRFWGDAIQPTIAPQVDKQGTGTPGRQKSVGCRAGNGGEQGRGACSGSVWRS